MVLPWSVQNLPYTRLSTLVAENLTDQLIPIPARQVQVHAFSLIFLNKFGVLLVDLCHLLLKCVKYLLPVGLLLLSEYSILTWPKLP